MPLNTSFRSLFLSPMLFSAILGHLRYFNLLDFQGFLHLDTAVTTAPGHFIAIPKICAITHAVISNKNSELIGKN